MLVLLFVFFLFFPCILAIEVPFDAPNNMFFIKQSRFIKPFFNSPAVQQSFLVVITSENYDDPYLGLYTSRLVHLFDNLLEIPTVFAMVTKSPDLTYDETVLTTLYHLPPRSLFVCIQHGNFRIHFFKLMQMLQLLKKPNLPMLFHLNHEQPWIHDDTSLDFVYNTTEELTDQYKSFPLVLRNYYYQPLLSSSHYLPVGYPYLGFILNNKTTEYPELQDLIYASDREHFCFFQGRVTYNESQSMNDRDLMNHALITSQYCQYSHSSPFRAGYSLDYYINYIRSLANTAFVLCPSGNNPETFRLHEALEVNSIPILVKINEPDKNFLFHESWKDYPGPVLNNWNELDEFLFDYHNNPQKINELQQKLHFWYLQFKEKNHRLLQDKIKQSLLTLNLLDVKTSSSVVSKSRSHKSKTVKQEEIKQSSVENNKTKDEKIQPEKQASPSNTCSCDNHHNSKSSPELQQLSDKYEKILKTMMKKMIQHEDRIKQLETIISQNNNNNSLLISSLST